MSFGAGYTGGIVGSQAQTSAPAAQSFSYNGITFDWTQFETPENLELSWRTLGGVEDIPSANGVPAQRVAQTFGVVMDTIKFDASFIGPSALTKALALEALQKAQASGPFQFGSRTITCTIFALRERYRTINDIGYSLELEPLVEKSNGAPAAGSSATASLTANVSDIGDYVLADVPDDEMPDTVAPALNLAQTTNVPGASLSTLQTLASTFTAANNDLQALMTLKSTSTAPGDVQTYLAAAGLVGLLSSAVATIGSFTGSTGTPVATSGANAYQLAVRYTGDINNTDTIMAANNLTDPFNLGTSSIIIPSVLKAL